MLEPVPLLLTPAVRRWACKMRGACCKVHRIAIDRGEQRRMARALREANDERATVMEGELPLAGGILTLPMKPSGECIFLSADHRCELRPLGTRERPVYPSICQQFPYLSLLTPEHHVFGLTLSCPTALELFAFEEEFTLIEEPAETEPPVDRVTWLGADDREYLLLDGTPTDGKTFWRTHWDWFARFRARPETNPIERLTRLAEEVSGLEAPQVPMMSQMLWRQAAYESSLVRQIERLAGVQPKGLDYLWVEILGERNTYIPPESNTDADGLLMRYLMHRFLVNPAYVDQTSLGFMLATLFAMACRFKIELARGRTPVHAARECDRVFIHLQGAGATIGFVRGEPMWRAFCALANAVTV